MPWQDPHDPRSGSWKDFLDMTMSTYRIILPVLFLLLTGLGIALFILWIIF
jgi:hypothetical protein|tara:strand:- start:1164 stop:1316 length:153 start_codon:yes stop_codon:yes gene_type:complete